MPEQRADYTAKTREWRGRTRFTCYRVTCAACGYVRTMKRADAAKAVRNGSCKRCSAREKGAKGFRAAVIRHGFRWVLPHVRTYQFAHPSKPEQAVDRVLAGLGVGYERQHLLETRASGKKRWGCLLDFLVQVGGHRLGVEVNGAYWHNQPKHARADRRKRALCKRRGIVLVTLDAAALTTPAGRDHTADRLRVVVASLHLLDARLQ